MKFDFLQAARVAARIIGIVVPGVSAVETIASQFGSLKGKQKQDAIVEMVRASLATAESLSGRELAGDEDVERATRGVVDAVVALHNILARKQAAPSL